jgi:cytosine/adenosine deaminase-related metal-dependent hydrolase
MRQRPYSVVKSLPLKWKKSANYFLQFTGTTATYDPVLYLGELDELGTIKAGKRADLMSLKGNPLEDIANTRQIVGVII